MPDIRLAGYLVLSKSRIPNIRPDIWFDNYIFGKIIRSAGYPANPKARYQISGKGRIPDIWQDIRPDTWVDNYIFGKISNKFIKIALTIIDFRQTLNNA
jgi:hypothetical protein